MSADVEERLQAIRRHGGTAADIPWLLDLVDHMQGRGMGRHPDDTFITIGEAANRVIAKMRIVS